MGSIYQIKPGRKFTIEEAGELLPLVRRITEDYVKSAEIVITKMSHLTNDNLKEKEKFEQEFQDVVEQWATKIHKLGAYAKGLWLVDFDNGEGFYCWKHPEDKLSYFHTYEDSFAGRLPMIEEITKTV